MDIVRVPFDDLVAALRRVLAAAGFAPDRAALCADLFAQADRDGVYSHGVRRFADFVRACRGGQIDPSAEPVQVGGFGAVEQWDGRRGPGNLNAHAGMARAIELARLHGIACVALRNTNHWLRAGAYGWQAAEAGCVALCWTNTDPNMPPWGARDWRLGNNPLVVAVPRRAGHVVLDMAMSQFSWGRIGLAARSGEALPAVGGYDEAGEPTTDAAAIRKTGRILPAGLWKGSGLALVLDLAAAMLSRGAATWQLADPPGADSPLHVAGPSRDRPGPSQVFLAVDLARLVPPDEADRVADEVIRYALSAAPLSERDEVLYPGRRTLRTRQENLRLGVPVPADAWRELQAM